jgi:hypothetical protein
MPPSRFEPKIPASERRMAHALDRAATRIGEVNVTRAVKLLFEFNWLGIETSDRL